MARQYVLTFLNITKCTCMDINFIIITFVGLFLQIPFNSGFYNYISSSEYGNKEWYNGWRTGMYVKKAVTAILRHFTAICLE